MQILLSIAVFVGTFVSALHAQSDFQCPELMGRYQDPFDCARFYVCSYGNAYQFSCDNGTRYDHDIGVCRHAADVICRTGNQLMTEAFTCPTMNGMYRDLVSCNHFYLCANGRHFRLACPPGLQFNGAVCTWKSANSCKGSADYENEVNWKSDLKIPSNEVDKDDLPMYKSSFENSNNDVEFENEYYDSTPEEGGSDFPRFVDKVKTMDDIDTIQIGLLAPKGKKMSAETTDRTIKHKAKTTTKATTKATTTTRKPTTTTKPTTTKQATTTSAKITTTKKTTTAAASTTKATKTTPGKITKKVAKLLKTTQTVPTTQKAKTTTKAQNTTMTDKNLTFNVTLDSVNTTQSASTTKKSSTSKSSKTTVGMSSTTAQTMKAVKYNGAKALISDTSAKPKSSSTTKPTTKIVQSTTKTTQKKTTQKAAPTVPPTVASNHTGNDTLEDDNNTTLSLQNFTLDANVTNNSNDTDNSTSIISDDDTSNNTSSSVSSSTTSSTVTKVSSSTTAKTSASTKDKVQKTKTTTKVTKEKVAKPTTAKTTPNKRKVSRSVDSVKRRGDAKFRLDSVQLKQ